MQRAVLVLDRTPDTESAAGIAHRVAKRYAEFDQEMVLWSIETTLPDWVSVGLSDQLTAHMRDAGIDACFMIVVMCTEEEFGDYLP